MQIRVHFDLILTDPSTTDAAISRINTYLTNHPAAIVEQAPTGDTRHGGEPHVVADLLYLTAQDAQALRDQLVSMWTSGNLSSRIATGSRVAWHACRHDEGAGDCSGASGERTVK